MQVVILAGGMGTRLGPLAAGRPKALVPVCGRAFIEHQFDLLTRSGLRDVLLCVGFRGEMLQAHVGDGARFGLRVAYAVEPPDGLLGTGGALVHALPQLRDAFLILYGDSYLPTDYRPVVRAFERAKPAGLMTVFHNDGQWDKSNVRVADGRVVFYSKAAQPGEAQYIDYGLSLLTKAVVARYAKRPAPLDLAVIFGDLVARGELMAHEVRERFYEIGKPEGLAELERLLDVNKCRM